MHFVETSPFDWEHPKSKELLKLLLAVYNDHRLADEICRDAGLTPISESILRLYWRLAIEEASEQKKLRHLLELVLKDERARAIHGALAELLSSGDSSSSSAEEVQREAEEIRREIGNRLSRLNPLLGEWESIPLLGKLVTDHARRHQLILLVALVALAGLILGHLAGANCIEATFQTEPPAAPHIGRLRYGFLSELVQGPWSLIGIPLTVLASLIFCDWAYFTLRELCDVSPNASTGARLIVVGADASRVTDVEPLSVIGAMNRRFVRACAWLYVPLSFVIVIGQEYVGYERTAFGWVQSAKVEQLEKGRWTAQALRERGLSAPLPLEQELCPQGSCQLRLTSISGGTRKPHQYPWFYALLVLALLYQLSFCMFALWMIAKITFFFYLLISSLRHGMLFDCARSRARKDAREKLRLRLELDFTDRSRRLGLSGLDRAYVGILYVMLLMAFALLLARINNHAKGTAWISPQGFSQHMYAHASQWFTFLLTCVSIGATFVIPIIVFDVLTERAKASEIAFLQARLQSAPASQRALKADLAEVHQQSPSPWRSPAYKWLLLLCVTFLIGLPFTITQLPSNPIGHWLISLLNSDMPVLFCGFKEP